MRAIGVFRYGGPEVLEEFELPLPEPGHREVRLRVHAAAINPVDRLWRNGALADWFASTEPPFVPGMDAAGVVDATGGDVDPELGLEPGRAVVAVIDNFALRGAYSDYVTAPVDAVVPAPTDVSHAEASSFLMPALTAREAIDRLGLSPGASVMVTGAAGGVGQQAVALAHAEGLHVVALAAKGDQRLLQGLGADQVVSRGQDVIHRVRALVPEGVDGLVDPADLHGAVVPAVRDGGTVISLSAWTPTPDRGIRYVHIDVRDRVRDRGAIAALRDQAQAGVLPLTVAETFPASEAVRAHTEYDKGGARGRMVLLFRRSKRSRPHRIQSN